MANGAVAMAIGAVAMAIGAVPMAIGAVAMAIGAVAMVTAAVAMAIGAVAMVTGAVAMVCRTILGMFLHKEKTRMKSSMCLVTTTPTMKRKSGQFDLSRSSKVKFKVITEIAIYGFLFECTNI